MKFEVTIIVESPRHPDESISKEALEFFATRAWREHIMPLINGDSKDETAHCVGCKLLER